MNTVVIVKPNNDALLNAHYLLLKDEHGNILPWDILPESLLSELAPYVREYTTIPMQQDCSNRALVFHPDCENPILLILNRYGITTGYFNNHTVTNLQLPVLVFTAGSVYNLNSEVQYPWGKLGLNFDITNQVLYVMLNGEICVNQDILNRINYYAEQLQPMWLNNLNNLVYDAILAVDSEDNSSALSQLCHNMVQLWLANAKALSLCTSGADVSDIEFYVNSICALITTFLMSTIILVYHINQGELPTDSVYLTTRVQYWVRKHLVTRNI